MNWQAWVLIGRPRPRLTPAGAALYLVVEGALPLYHDETQP